MKLTKQQVNKLKEKIEKMNDSDEQFFFMLFKEKNGRDCITQHSYNTRTDKLVYYFQKAIKSRKVITKKK